MERILKAMETERGELIFKSPDGKAVAKIDGVEFEVLIKNAEKMRLIWQRLEAHSQRLPT